jgi:hypothetical protein
MRDEELAQMLGERAGEGGERGVVEGLRPSAARVRARDE